jgi:hypothetical protein
VVGGWETGGRMLCARGAGCRMWTRAHPAPDYISEVWGSSDLIQVALTQVRLVLTRIEWK